MGQNPTSSLTKTTCKHCGDPCLTETIVQDGNSFCCSGCSMVYVILQENNLLDFYRIDERAGARQNKKETDDYAWLDVPKLAARFVRYRDEKRCHAELELPGIHCSSCLWLLERLPRLLPGVRSCTIDFSRKLGTVVFDPQATNLRQITEMLDRIGYPPHFRAQGEVADKNNNRALIYRIGVAGFCFGNIMLMSFPEYFGLSELLAGAAAGSGWVKVAMNGLLLLLSLPVMFYAGRGFFTSAAYALQARRVTIDLPIALGMLALFGRSFYEILSGAGAGYLDSLAGLVFFLLIGRWFQTYSFARLNFDRDYRDYFPVAAYREDDAGAPVPIASEDVEAGDVLLIRPGQLLPADGTLLSAVAHGIDYSFVTGEAEPAAVHEGQEVFAGGRATASALRVLVTKPTDQSYLLDTFVFDKTGTLTEEGSTDRLSFVSPRSGSFEAVFLAMARQSTHPRSKEIVRALSTDAPEAMSDRIGEVEEVTGKGLRLQHQGREFLIGSPAFCGFPNYTEGTFAAIDGLLQFSLKPRRSVIRTGAGEMLREMNNRGDTWLLSGDHTSPGNIWEKYFPGDRARFRQSPFDKRQHVGKLQENGAGILMVGDGLNDAGALAAATVGLAVNEDEARFNPACDGIVKAERLTNLPAVLRATKRMKPVIHTTYLLAFAYNVVGLSYAMTGALSPVVAAILMPLSSVTIVVVASLGAGIVWRRK